LAPYASETPDLRVGDATPSAAKTLPPEDGPEVSFAAPELASEFLKGIQAAWPSHELLKLTSRLFPALFLKKGRQCLIGHFQAIP
jgi:hypothetical protein